MENQHTSRDVLYVEDELVSRLAIAKELETQDLNLHLARNRSETLEIVSNSPIDLILMDIRLGKEDGIEIVTEIHGIKYIPVIYMTASTDTQTFDRALPTSPMAIVDKPIDPQHLIKTLQMAFRMIESFNTRQMAQNGDLLGLIYDTAEVGMCVTDDTGTFVKVNKAYCRTYGYAEEYLVGKNFTLVLPEDMKAYAQKMHDDFIYEHILELPSDWKVRTASGDIRDVFVTAGRFVDAIGKVFKVTTVTDITERNQYLSQLESTIGERDMLMREIHHRVKNNLNLLSTMFRLQLSTLNEDSSPKEVLETGILRMRSLALLHEKLYAKDAMAAIDVRHYLDSIVTNVRQLMLKPALRFKMEVDPMEVEIDTAIAVGLIVNELVTNAVKHAFSEEQEGAEQEIELHLQANGEGFVLSISDNGTPIPEGFDPLETNSTGLQIVTALSEQLNGQLQFEQSNGKKRFFLHASPRI